jgi:tRNA-2-methylthio-N6-dimethylallyladenosine synthase
MLDGKSIYIKSYGCQMNVYDSERMEENLESFGCKKVSTYEDSDIIILNTCHIRQNPTANVYSELGRIRLYKDQMQKIGKQVVVIVAGCVAQAEGEQIIKQAPVVDIVVGTESYQNLPDLIQKAIRTKGERFLSLEFDTVEKFDLLTKPRKKNNSSSAFIAVQEGCDKFCTFCVVPYTRGAEFSRSVKDIINEVKNLADQGIVEVNLLGQNVNAYHGLDVSGKEVDIVYLFEEISKIDQIKRIRYTTSHPVNMTKRLIEAHGSIEKLMPYLHLPIQSGSNKILQAMNRKHDRDFYLKIIEDLRSKRQDISLSTDIIVGFPGETDQDFLDTMDIVSRVCYSQSYAFKYSQRPGTPADTMKDQVLENIKDERLFELQKLLQKQFDDFNKNTIGKVVDVLFESKGKRKEYNQVVGKTPYLQAIAVNI